MGMIEVKVNLSFGTWQRGKFYAVDEDDPKTQGLIAAGYLTKVNDELGAAPLSEPEQPEQPKKRRVKKKVPDGEDRTESARGDADGAAQSDSDGDQAVPADAAGSKKASPKG